MKSYFSLLATIGFLAIIGQIAADEAKFFRISGPATTTIITFSSDGTLVWSNAQPGATYTVQTATSVTEETNWVDYVQLPVTNSVNTNLIITFNPPEGMALIPAGSFMMGNSTGDLDITDAIPANVYVSGFYMDKNLVGYGQWQKVYNYANSHGYSIGITPGAIATNQPVSGLQWYNCAKWCNARSQLEGLTPVYYLDEGFTEVYSNGYDNMVVYADWSANGYRLPTEAEWEKAARSGLSGLRFPWGNTISESQANYYARPNPPNADGFIYDLGPYTGYNTNFQNSANWFLSPSSYFAPNSYGLYDMAGNLAQWCWDGYAGPPYPSGSPYLGGVDPHGPAFDPYGYGVQRGGAWNSYSSELRCANRLHRVSRSTSSNFGFRCVRRY